MPFEYQALLILHSFLIPACLLILWWDRRDRRRRTTTTTSADSANEMARLDAARRPRARGSSADRSTAEQEHCHSPDSVRVAVRDAMEARGITEVAQATGLPREDIEAVLTPEARPPHDTVMAVTHALGLRVRIEPRHPQDT